jgi:hypothetical protein
MDLRLGTSDQVVKRHRHLSDCFLLIMQEVHQRSHNFVSGQSLPSIEATYRDQSTAGLGRQMAELN